MDIDFIYWLLIIGGVAAGGVWFWKRNLSDEAKTSSKGGGSNKGNSDPDYD